MIYNYDADIQLQPHFHISEFACKCGNCHATYHNPELSEKLEQLYNKLNCSKIIVNSGYRCTDHDKAVGGSGKGQHVDGNAADIVCYGQDGQPISSKIVCCKAQDIGFGGIANIDKSYTATHVDVRSSNFWKGDETVTTAYSVTEDFYGYFGIKRESESDGKKTIKITVDFDDHKYSGLLEEI